MAAVGIFLPTADKIEPDNDPFFFREIADELAKGRGYTFDQGGNSDYLFAFGHFGMLKDVDNFQFITAIKMLITNLLKILDCTDRTGVHPTYKKPQDIGLIFFRGLV